MVERSGGCRRVGPTPPLFSLRGRAPPLAPLRARAAGNVAVARRRLQRHLPALGRAEAGGPRAPAPRERQPRGGRGDLARGLEGDPGDGSGARVGGPWPLGGAASSALAGEAGASQCSGIVAPTSLLEWSTPIPIGMPESSRPTAFGVARSQPLGPPAPSGAYGVARAPCGRHGRTRWERRRRWGLVGVHGSELRGSPELLRSVQLVVCRPTANGIVGNHGITAGHAIAGVLGLTAAHPGRRSASGIARTGGTRARHRNSE